MPRLAARVRDPENLATSATCEIRIVVGCVVGKNLVIPML